MINEEIIRDQEQIKEYFRRRSEEINNNREYISILENVEIMRI